jgi:hypothetical protein
MKAFFSVLVGAAVALTGCGGSTELVPEGRSSAAQTSALPEVSADSSKRALGASSLEGAKTAFDASLLVGKGASKKMLHAMLTDSDPHNDSYALMILEAGGFSEYFAMDTQQRAGLQLRHSVETLTQPDLPSGNAESLAVFGDPVTPCVPHLDSSFRGRTITVSGTPGIVYSVDAVGRAGTAVAQYTDGHIPTAPRSGCQTTVGTWGAPPQGQQPPIGGYEGGHVIASSLGGTYRRYNLTPQAFQINRSTFKKVEEVIRRCAGRADRKVTFAVAPGYLDLGNAEGNVTPGSYFVIALVEKRCGFSGPYSCGGGEAGVSIPNWTGTSSQTWIIPGQTPPPTITAINARVDVWADLVATHCQ